MIDEAHLFRESPPWDHHGLLHERCRVVIMGEHGCGFRRRGAHRAGGENRQSQLVHLTGVVRPPDSLVLRAQVREGGRQRRNGGGLSGLRLQSAGVRLG